MTSSRQRDAGHAGGAVRTDLAWQRDAVTTRSGVVVPVRATARRPHWEQLPAPVREVVESAAGAGVDAAHSTGTGFTPGFASRLDLATGSRIFVKAASSADDTLHGWPLSDAYREEARKLRALPPGIGSPVLLWSLDEQIDGVQWVILGFENVDGAPPRRPWRLAQLHLVLAKLAAIAPALANPPAELALAPAEDDLLAGYPGRLARIRESEGDGDWLHTVDRLCAEAAPLLRGASVVHLDLRDDNILIDTSGEVWFCDWNLPAIGAPWIDLLCVLLSAKGDGLDADRLIADHPLTRDVDGRSIDCLLAALWSFWGVARTQPVPAHSPHLRDHQTWYADVTRGWLEERLAARCFAADELGLDGRPYAG
ncbi:MAG: phosphotransferase family protein [Nocardioidaceae bacterium]